MTSIEQSKEQRAQFLEVFIEAGFRKSPALSLVQPSIKTSFLFSVGFVDVLAAIAGKATELDGAATVQRCFRHFDIERVGDDRHLSFFEMAGVLKCSDWTVDDLADPLVRFLIEICQLPKERLHATFFSGEDHSGNFQKPDRLAREAYIKAGVLEDQIWSGDNTTNIWFEGANSGTERSGICGPHSEIFFDMDPQANDAIGANPLTHQHRFLEVSNIVTITHQARNGTTGGVEPLPQPLVELATGMERIEVARGGNQDVYQTPKLKTIGEAIRSFSDTIEDRALRIAVDHTRAITNLMADGARPGPKGQRHVVRKLFRGLIEAADNLKLDLCEAYPSLIDVVIQVDESVNPHLKTQRDTLVEVFIDEITRMTKTSK